MTFRQATEKLSKHPRSLFLVDGFGALLSVFLLGVVLVRLERVVGIPVPTLYFLASLPCFFAVFDFICYYKLKNDLAVFLKGIAVFNLVYCGISLSIAIHHHDVITHYGWYYVLIEIFIIVALALFEIRIANTVNYNER